MYVYFTLTMRSLYLCSGKSHQENSYDGNDTFIDISLVQLGLSKGWIILYEHY